MAIRSGRFSSANANSGLTIIREGKTGAFRIYNSGEKAFIVKPNGVSTPTGDQITLQPRGSVDIEVGGAVIIQASAGKIEGIYEFIDPFRPIRGGRFNGDASATGITIAQERDPELYRVLNSGDGDINVEVGGALIQVLKPTFSIDVVAGSKITVTGGTKVEGIYDYLDPRNDIKSGRFKIKAVAMYPHKIIDLKGNNDIVWYRLFNSGDEEITIEEGTNQLVGKVAKEQSFDFQVSKGTSKRAITVRHVPAAGDAQPIEGIYEFLGRED